MTKPFLHEVVHYYPTAEDPALKDLETPVIATVSHIWSDTCVNLSIDDPRLPQDAVCLRSSVLYGVSSGASYNYCKPSPFDRSADTPLLTDAAIEAEVKAKGLDEAPRITKDQIDNLMHRVLYTFEVPTGTTSTFCHAFLDGKFHLGTGHSACVSAENFNAQTGIKIAKGKAEQVARDKLWELEGYVLFKQIAQVSTAPSLAELRLAVFVDMTTGDIDMATVERCFAPLASEELPTREVVLRCADELVQLRLKDAQKGAEDGPLQHTEDPDHGEG